MEKTFSTRKLVLLALLTAIVAVLQYLGAFIRFGPFSVSLVLMPVAVGAALVGVLAGGWLGLAFGFTVLLTGDAAPFMAINPAATLAIVLLKGTFAGLAAGAVYRLFAVKSKTVAAVAAAVICPIVNTGVFLVGTHLFLLETIAEWGAAAGFADATSYIIFGMIGVNFLFELVLNLVLSPVIIRLIQYGSDRRERL